MTVTTAIRPEPATTTLDAAAVPVISIDHERCDRCGHRAYVVTDHGAARAPAYLSWCGHHHAANVRAGTVRADQVIIDVRERLTVRETGVHA